MTDPLLAIDAVSKSFGPQRALDRVTLELRGGEVHATVGENGAGKSTLMKVLAGAHRPDSGTMRLLGSPYAPRGPRDARRRGVAMIYQELNLAPHLSVEANVMLGIERSCMGFLGGRHDRRRVQDALSILGHAEVPPRTLVKNLNVGAQQIVEIARALVSDARVIILDEPTSSLTKVDAARLFTVVDRLRQRGLGILYISHFLEEVQKVADRYTVLRDGRTVVSGDMRETSLQFIISNMIGRELSEMFSRTARVPGAVLVELRGFSGRRLPRQVDLTLRRGEILGIAGLLGSGRTELLRAIFGLDRVRNGQIRVASHSGTHASPRARIRQGMGLLSEDRKGEGLALGRSLEDNITYSALGRYARWGWLNLPRRRTVVRDWMRRLSVRAESPKQAVVTLSGGNQQKVALARLLHQDAEVLLLDEPTCGIDVGSKTEIYRLIGELAAQGKAILLVSSYLPELLGVCDRVAVMTRGTLGPALDVESWTEHKIMEIATGAGV